MAVDPDRTLVRGTDAERDERQKMPGVAEPQVVRAAGDVLDGYLHARRRAHENRHPHAHEH